MDDAKPQIRVNLLRSSLAVRDRKLKQHKLNQWQDITSQHLNIYYTLNLVKKNIKNTLKINFFCEIWNVLIKKHTNDKITFGQKPLLADTDITVRPHHMLPSQRAVGLGQNISLLPSCPVTMRKVRVVLVADVVDDCSAKMITAEENKSRNLPTSHHIKRTTDNFLSHAHHNHAPVHSSH